MGYASGYTLDLYCDNGNQWPDGAHAFREFPHTFLGETWGGVAGEARAKGWLIRNRENYALCPKCSGKKPRAALKENDNGRT